MNFADVILPLPLQNVFTYEVPSSIDQLQVGVRVIVQFGQKKFYTAVVYKTHQTPPTHYIAKPIVDVLDEEAIVSTTQFDLWNWISNYYCCSLGEVMNAALPNSLKLSSESKIVLIEKNIKSLDHLSDKEFLVVEALKLQSELSLQQISQILNQKTIFPIINSLISKKIVKNIEELNDRYIPKKVRKVKMSQPDVDLSLFKNARKQLELINTFHNLINKYEINSISVNKLLNTASASYQSLNALINKGVFELFEEEISRLEKHTSTTLKSHQLSSAQDKAYSQLLNEFKRKNIVLLHGVTSSGKTELFIKLIKETINNGQQVLYLLPEIALTTQIINRLRNHFGDLIGVYHSKFNTNERVEIWDSVRKAKRFPIVIGTRSALFLPFNKLGLIIIDEEHENTFKQQQPSPRYHARDTAIKYAQLLRAKVLLASATPSLETYYNTQLGKYGLVQLHERYGGVQMPKIDLEDIKYIRHRKLMKGSFSPKLLEKIRDTLKQNEQVILFQNRRGFAPISQCMSCGSAAKCIYCDVSLTYHKQQELLKCHYCGYSENTNQKCKNCDAIEVQIKGFGTEKIEEELQVIFPFASIQRLDFDTTRKKHAYEQIINDFENHKIDILIGTQMVTKGLDFKKVSLVGIMNADSLLNFPDFRAFERSYQLMTQVSGRAGRANKQGKVLIQTFSASHQIIEAVQKNDYLTMFNLELLERKTFLYPPFCKIISITVSHKDNVITNKAARHLALLLRASFDKNVLGPEYPSVSRVKNRYLKKIIIKLSPSLSLNKSKKHLISLIEITHRQVEFKSVRFIIDVDPY